MSLRSWLEWEGIRNQEPNRFVRPRADGVVAHRNVMEASYSSNGVQRQDGSYAAVSITLHFNLNIQAHAGFFKLAKENLCTCL
jgi:hypothetical protein